VENFAVGWNDHDVPEPVPDEAVRIFNDELRDHFAAHGDRAREVNVVGRNANADIRRDQGVSDAPGNFRREVISRDRIAGQRDLRSVLLGGPIVMMAVSVPDSIAALTSSRSFPPAAD
jgi:hypothetical protein